MRCSRVGLALSSAASRGYDPDVRLQSFSPTLGPTSVASFWGRISLVGVKGGYLLESHKDSQPILVSTCRSHRRILIGPACVLCPHTEQLVSPKDVVLRLAQPGSYAHPCGPWGRMQWLTNHRNEGEVVPLKEGMSTDKTCLVNK